jgi:hypothetical protein
MRHSGQSNVEMEIHCPGHSLESPQGHVGIGRLQQGDLLAGHADPLCQVALAEAQRMPGPPKLEANGEKRRDRDKLRLGTAMATRFRTRRDRALHSLSG